ARVRVFGEVERQGIKEKNGKKKRAGKLREKLFRRWLESESLIYSCFTIRLNPTTSLTLSAETTTLTLERARRGQRMKRRGKRRRVTGTTNDSFAITCASAPKKRRDG